MSSVRVISNKPCKSILSNCCFKIRREKEEERAIQLIVMMRFCDFKLNIIKILEIPVKFLTMKRAC
jgi:hypothetical protein